MSYYTTNTNDKVQLRESKTGNIALEIHTSTYGGTKDSYVSGDELIVHTNNGVTWVYSASKRYRIR
jgi:hypothetical protein